MLYPFLYSLDAVEVTYDDSTREYEIAYHRVINNVGDQPLLSTPGRIFVNLFPDNLELTRQYYRLHPVHFKDLHFEAQDESGAVLVHEMTYENDHLIRFLIHFREAKTGRPLPVMPGEVRAIFYRYRISDRAWGAYLERALLVPCDQMAVTFRFPPGLIHLWGNHYTSTGEKKAIDPLIVSQTTHDQEIFTWSLDHPDFLGKYQFQWQFKDERLLKLKEEFLRQPGENLLENGKLTTHSEDFRSVVWFGQSYTFTNTQAACLEILWEAWSNQTPELGQAHILEAARSKAKRLQDLFSKHPAWKTMIARGEKKGTFRLRSPDEFPAPP
jgi:hypothetical protein